MGSSLSARAEARANEAIRAFQAGDVLGAVDILSRLLKKNPRHPDLNRLLGVMEHAAGRSASAKRRLERALRAAPSDPENLYNLAVVEEQTGDLQGAVGHYRRCLLRAGGHHQARTNLGALLERTESVEEAREVYAEGARRGEAGAATFAHAWGGVAASLGRFEEARQAYETALAGPQPEYAALRGLVMLHRRAKDSAPLVPLVERMVEALPRTTGAAQTALLFGLGTALDGLGRFDTAWPAFEAANAAVRSGLPASPGAMSELVGAWERTAEPIPNAVQAGGGGTPIFIVSAPRSGSTLVERLLAAHPEVEAGGERNGFLEAVAELLAEWPKSVPIEKILADWTRDPEIGSRLRARYLASVPESLREGRYFTDKQPDNLRWGWLVRRAFPEAPILHVRRHPAACGLSCFQEWFGNGLQTFSYDLRDIAGFLEDVERLRALWQRIGLGALTVDYEQLVSQPRDIMQSVLSSLGLAWDERCLDPREAAGAVRTASVVQVRRGLYAGAIEHWRSYAPHLGPLLSLRARPPGEAEIARGA